MGINFTCVSHDNGNKSIHLGQPAFIEFLASLANINNPHMNFPCTLYQSGYPVDKISSITSTFENQHELTEKMQQLLGCLNWLTISTWPDIATITNILSKYTSKPTPQHLDHVKYVIKYLINTKDHGIAFSSKHNHELQSFFNFPVNTPNIKSMCDTNCGPQDTSIPKTSKKPQQLELFKSRSISGYLTWFLGPLHWLSKRQNITTCSLAKAKIYAMDKCVKSLKHFSFLVNGLNITLSLISTPTVVYNDNAACIQWSVNLTTKGLRHIQI